MCSKTPALCCLACRVLATSRTPYYQQAAEMGAEFYEDVDDFCEEHPDVVLLATSILSTEPVLRSLPLTRLKRSTLVVDVLSVKVCLYSCCCQMIECVVVKVTENIRQSRKAIKQKEQHTQA